jgi:hypothetical protein
MTDALTPNLEYRKKHKKFETELLELMSYEKIQKKKTKKWKIEEEEIQKKDSLKEVLGIKEGILEKSE